MPEPLIRKEKEGASYKRPPEVEAWILKLETTEVEERLRQFAIPSRKSIGYVPSEALFYFLRRAWVDGEHGDFKILFDVLIKRIELSLRSAISDLRFSSAGSIREEIMGRFAEKIAKDCTRQTGLMDFFEVHFDQAFAAFRITALRQIGPTVLEIVPLGTYEENGLEISAEVEAAAAQFLSGDPEKIDDPAFRLELFTAIDCLPEDQKQVVGLLLQGFQIDSNDENTMTIARILQCDERTVRNRRDRAYKALRVILQKENAQ